MTKPKKLIFCPIIRRKKQLFETEEKALRFAEYNSCDINTHGGTFRAYYCEGCGGWHLTHLNHKQEFDDRAKQFMLTIEKNKKATGKPSKKTKEENLVCKKEKTANSEFNEKAQIIIDSIDFLNKFISRADAKTYIKENYPDLTDIERDYIFHHINQLKFNDIQFLAKEIIENNNFPINSSDEDIRKIINPVECKNSDTLIKIIYDKLRTRDAAIRLISSISCEDKTDAEIIDEVMKQSPKNSVYEYILYHLKNGVIEQKQQRTRKLDIFEPNQYCLDDEKRATEIFINITPNIKLALENNIDLEDINKTIENALEHTNKFIVEAVKFKVLKLKIEMEKNRDN